MSLKRIGPGAGASAWAAHAHAATAPTIGAHRIKDMLSRPFRRLPHGEDADRKSTRLNSSHLGISYAVFCLKKSMAHGRLGCAYARASQRTPLHFTDALP